MTNGLSVTRTRFADGVWEGEVQGAGPDRPAVEVLHEGRAVPDVQLTADEAGRWYLRVPVPPAAVGDGVHTLLIRAAETGETLESVTLSGGETLEEELRAEVARLRAELDLLKRAVRRHAREG
jgi:hypothetical protein